MTQVKEGKSRRSGILGRRQDGEPEVAAAPQAGPEPAREGNGHPTWPEFWFEESGAEGTAATAQPRTAPAARPDNPEPQAATRVQPEPEPQPRPSPAPRAPADEQPTTEQPAAAAAAPPRAPPQPTPATDGPRRPQLPRTVGPMEAFVRHPVVTILPILLAVGAAVFIGLDRSPEYTAKSRIQVGRTNVPAYVLQNVVGGNQALAAAYSRVISTTPVVGKAARATGVSAADVRNHVDATPIPGSTLIQVEARGSSRRGAIDLANEAARALISYVAKVSRDTRSRTALTRYRRAATEVVRLQRRANTLSNAGPNRLKDLQRAIVDVDAAKLRASNLSNVYRAISADPTSGSPLKLIAPAATASSDRRQVLEQLILIGVAAGLVLGLGLALLLANRGKLRAMRE
jgi:capsular polysaccharide biosynthesis protein